MLALPLFLCQDGCIEQGQVCQDAYEITLRQGTLGQIMTMTGVDMEAPKCTSRIVDEEMQGDNQDTAWFVYARGAESLLLGKVPLLRSTIVEGFRDRDMYPAETTTYIDTDGSEYATQCVNIDSTIQGDFSACPYPKVVNEAWTIDGDASLCTLPCPSFMFETGEYRLMQLFLVVPGLGSLLVNLYMFLHALMNPEVRKFATFYCYGAGIVWGTISPVMSMIYFTDVACADGCGSLDCAGGGTVCMVYKASPFLVQSMQIMVASLCMELYMKVKLGWMPTRCNPHLKKVRFVAVTFPMALLGVSYAIETGTKTSLQFHHN